MESTVIKSIFSRKKITFQYYSILMKKYFIEDKISEKQILNFQYSIGLCKNQRHGLLNRFKQKIIKL